MMNNDNYDNVNNYYYDVIAYVFTGLFLLTLIIFFFFCVFAYFKWFKGKYTNNNNNKIYTYNYKNEY